MIADDYNEKAHRGYGLRVMRVDVVAVKTKTKTSK